ncbi:MAG: type II toxin-antitoxin system Phd/YefM family antitoxin [Acidimicrobiales bacterium]|jgi:antitoxin (DNA-binding transcriptional repressor) of toxin-antitoxin stability system
MREISATEAARNFSELLDAIEHHGEHFTIVRHGKAIAELEPASSSRGKDAKALLRRHRPDRGWVRDLREVRDLLETDVTR